MPFPKVSDPYYCKGSLTALTTPSLKTIRDLHRCSQCGRLVTLMHNGKMYPHLIKCKRTEKWDALHDIVEEARTSVRIIDFNV